jgi:hypothetical protein
MATLQISIENFITIAIMVLVLMLTFHLVGQIGVRLPSWANLGGS